MDIARVITLLSDKSTKAKPRKRRRRRYMKRDRDARWLAEYMREHSIRSKRQLRRMAETDRTAPSPYEFEKAWGMRWGDIKAEIWGPPPPDTSPPNDPEYTVKCVLEFSLWSQRTYLAERRAKPKIIPSARQVRRVFGRHAFTNLFAASKKASTVRTLVDYVKLRRRLGRWPSATDVRSAGLDLQPLTKMWGRGGNKWELDAFLKDAFAAQERFENGAR